MIDIKLHTPVGVKDILPFEARVKKEIIKRMENIFEVNGYDAVESPMFEYIEVFSDEKMGSTNPRQMFRFFDSKGSELALRSDMTPPIARIAATAYSSLKGPLRLSYVGNAFRLNESYQGKLCEFTQAGVELMGIKSVHADAEVVALAIKCVLSSGIKEFRIHIGQVDFFNNILKETNFSKKDCDKLKKIIAERNYVGVEDFLEEREINNKTKTLFSQLPKLVGKAEILEKAKKLTESKEAAAALDEMKELYEYLKLYGVAEHVVFDLGMVSGLNYYTGIIFRGYTYGTGYSIVDGGRYDNLVVQFGKNTPAVGFGIKINEIITVIERENIIIETQGTKAMISFSQKGMVSAIKAADIYRREGVKVEVSLIGDDFEENICYAQEKGFESILYFVDAVNIKYARIAEGIGVMVSDITINDLVKPQKEASK